MRLMVVGTHRNRLFSLGKTRTKHTTIHHYKGLLNAQCPREWSLSSNVHMTRVACKGLHGNGMKIVRTTVATFSLQRFTIPLSSGVLPERCLGSNGLGRKLRGKCFEAELLIEVTVNAGGQLVKP